LLDDTVKLQINEEWQKLWCIIIRHDDAMITVLCRHRIW